MNMMKLGSRMLLTILALCLSVGCAVAGPVNIEATPDQIAIAQQIITAWDKQYSAAELVPNQWNLEAWIQEFFAADLTMPLEELTPKLDAMQTALLAILTDEAYMDIITVEYLAQFVPYIGFTDTDGVPQWFFNFFSPDEATDPNGFTAFVNAETGKLMSIVYGPGNG